MKEIFKKINYKSLTVRTIIFIIATAICEFGISCYYTARLGTDPISVFVEGTSFRCNLTVGQISTICNIILGILFFIFERNRIGIGTFIAIFISGPLIDLFYGILLSYFPNETTSFSIRCIILAVGIITYALGLALSITCEFGVGPFSFPPIFLARILKVDLRYTQIATDAVFFTIGTILGGIIGFGTVLSVLLTGPLLSWFIKLIKPSIDKLGPIFNK